MARIPMDQKELREARRIGIPEYIVSKMAVGIEPNESEKRTIKVYYDKVYVEAHKKNGKWVKPFLRDLPGGSNPRIRSRSNPREEVNIKKMSNSELNKYLMELQSERDELKPKFTSKFRDALRKGVSYKSPEGRKISEMGGKIDDIESLQDKIMDEMANRDMEIPVIRE